LSLERAIEGRSLVGGTARATVATALEAAGEALRHELQALDAEEGDA
jgi:hypothetical protein